MNLATTIWELHKVISDKRKHIKDKKLLEQWDLETQAREYRELCTLYEAHNSLLFAEDAIADLHMELKKEVKK